MKKAVSPLIASVLLVMIVITLGSLMATWFNQYISGSIRYAEEKTSGDFQCTNYVYFDLAVVDEKIQICDNFIENSSNNTIIFTVQNKGESDIFLKTQIIGNKDIATKEFNTSLVAGSTNTFDYVYGNTTGALSQVKLTPNILVDGEIVECRNIHITIPKSIILDCPLLT